MVNNSWIKKIEQIFKWCDIKYSIFLIINQINATNTEYFLQSFQNALTDIDNQLYIN